MPNLEGRIVMQDLATVLAREAPVEGIEQMPHGFWLEPQPIQGECFLLVPRTRGLDV